MSEYNVRYMKGNLPELGGKIVDPNEIFAGIEYMPIANYPWTAEDGPYTPEARAYMFYNEQGIHIALFAKEETIGAKEKRYCGDVYLDSCLEAFITPNPNECADYVNVETNCIGTAHIGIGAGRYGRRHPKEIQIAVTGHDGSWWGVAYTLPMAFLKEEFGVERLAEGTEMRGNFFACDSTLHTHHGTWHPITTEHPDYHRPEMFGALHFRNETVSFM